MTATGPVDLHALLGRMTLAEKLGQMTMTAVGTAVTGPVIAGDSTQAIRDGTIGNLLNLTGAEANRGMQRLAVEESRLGIPLLLALDVIHGYRTIFPVPLGEAALFDPLAWERTAREAAVEAAADGLAMTFAPMLDVARDPRWGRIVEGPGEDAWLASAIARAKTRGFQGAALSAPEAIAACAKHFCAYAPVTAGREYAAVDVSERSVHEVYLPPFEAAVQEGVATVMPAFTDLAGVPMSANAALIDGWLRRHLGFEGVIVSDYNAIAELMHHGVAADLPEAAALALTAGIDIDMMANAYRHGLPVALDRGLVSIGQVDAAVMRVLALKQRLGLFDDPYARGAHPDSAPALADRRALARDVAARSLVLLTNGDHDGRPALPLPSGIRRLAVIGPLAEAPADMRGPWAGNGRPDEAVGVVTGLRAALPSAQVTYAVGVPASAGDTGGIAEALGLCRTAEAIVLCLGETADMSGEAASRSDLGLPGRQGELADRVLRLAAEINRPVVVVLFSGRPLVVPWLLERADAVIAAWFPGSEAGNGIADVLTGRVSPGGRTPVSWPRAIGQVPVFFGQRPSGRPEAVADHFTSKYIDLPNTPQVPFGHGLTYGRFRYGALRVTPSQVGRADTLRIEVDLANDGPMRAEETVFLFVHDPVARITRPLMELKGFAKIALGPGERGTARLSLAVKELAYLGPDLQAVFEAGDIDILAGPSADPTRLLVSRIKVMAESL